MPVGGVFGLFGVALPPWKKGRVPLRHVLFRSLYHFPFIFSFLKEIPFPHGIVIVNGYPEPKGGDLLPREHEDWVRQLYLTHAPDLYRAARYRLQDPELAPRPDPGGLF